MTHLNYKNLFCPMPSTVEALLIDSTDKVGCAFPMAIWSKVRMRQHRDDGYQGDTSHFSLGCIVHDKKNKVDGPEELKLSLQN